ncbi:MAG TPA: ABC transporter ATP-binding protein [Gemmatimonadales bacterium]|nr:ABC transporter ATP-binding protein [Gemmatimonadales bacterium]
MLACHDLVLRYRNATRPAVGGVSLAVNAGELVCVTGPNGSGKSTLLRGMLGLLHSERGTATIDDKDVCQWEPANLAAAVGVVPQREEITFPLRVRETVLLGRYARLGPLGAVGLEDRAAVERALIRCDVAQFADRRVDQLSGGEWQRVRVARALAGEPRALVLDEPTMSLDVRHEMEMFELVRELADQGLAALIITHGLNLAARFADRILLMSDGHTAALGTPAEVLIEPILSRVFQWPVAVTTTPDGAPQVMPLRRPTGAGAI